jgi:hypothetical protein
LHPLSQFLPAARAGLRSSPAQSPTATAARRFQRRPPAPVARCSPFSTVSLRGRQRPHSQPSAARSASQTAGRPPPLSTIAASSSARATSVTSSGWRSSLPTHRVERLIHAAVITSSASARRGPANRRREPGRRRDRSHGGRPHRTGTFRARQLGRADRRALINSGGAGECQTTWYASTTFFGVTVRPGSTTQGGGWRPSSDNSVAAATALPWS